MKWNKKEEPDVGTVRTRTVFLVLPKEIAGKWRWLETATFTEEYTSCAGGLLEGELHSWTAKEWVD